MRAGAHPHLALVCMFVWGMVVQTWLTSAVDRGGVRVEALGAVELGGGLRASRMYVLPGVGDTQRPPRGDQGDGRAILETVDPLFVESRCRVAGARACMIEDGGRLTVVVPNPCRFPWEAYAVLVCHEMGHVLGWRHGDGL